METSKVLLVCIVVTCAVWTVEGRNLKVQTDDEEMMDVDISVEAGRLPGVCWACKWVLNKVKKVAGKNATVEKLSSKLTAVCDQIGLLKSVCRKFVKANLGVLVEELTTTDDVRTICVNVRACSQKEMLDLPFHQGDDDSEADLNEYA